MDIRKRELTRGDFTTFIVNNQMRVPPEVYRICQRFGIGTVEEFIGFLWENVEVVALEMEWNTGEVVEARERLIADLKHFIDEKYLQPPLPKKPIVSPPLAQPQERKLSFIGRFYARLMGES